MFSLILIDKNIYLYNLRKKIYLEAQIFKNNHLQKTQWEFSHISIFSKKINNDQNTIIFHRCIFHIVIC